MLEKTEGAIKNKQSRDIGITGYTRHRTETKQIKPITQKTKKMSNMDHGFYVLFHFFGI